MPDESSYPNRSSGVNTQKQLPKGVKWETVDLTHYFSTDDQLWLTKTRLHAIYASGLAYIDVRTGKTLKKFDEKWNGFSSRPDFAPPLLYNILKVREAIRAGKTVYIVEGELKAKALEAWGYVATTNEHGAKAWTAGHAFLLISTPNAANARFVILNDDDKPGKDWADDVGRSLVNHTTVQLLSLTGIVNDIVDWIAEGHTKPEFEQLVPREWTPFSPPRSKDKPQQTIPQNLIKPSREFVADFMPPDYLIDNLFQRRFIYSITAPTGRGKTLIVLLLAILIALGRNLGNREVVKGKVLFLAGENPDDVRMRWIKLCEEYGVEPSGVDVCFVDGSYKLSQINDQIEAESATHGPFALVIVDTSIAFSDSDDEDDNVQQYHHALRLRSLTRLPDGPTILVTCHPPKHAKDPDEYLPRGGGAFVNEFDGNAVCIKEPNRPLVQLHWRGKYRGVDFAPIPFMIRPGTTEKLKDSRGRLIYTVTARPVTEQEQTHQEELFHDDEDCVLLLVRDRPTLSMTEMAEALGWCYATGEPNKRKVQTILDKLRRDKLVKLVREKWKLTPSGETAAAEISVRNTSVI